jgi:hypothetical protein
VLQSNGVPLRMPVKGPASRSSGLTLSIDSRWTNSYGYQPVEVTVMSATPTRADRTIDIQLHAGWNNSVCAVQTVELPTGSMSATATMLLPVFQSNANNVMWWDVSVDGRKDKDLSAEQNSSFSWAARSTGVSSNLSFLVVGPPQSNRTLVSTNATEFEALSLEMSKLPTHWIAYTALDVVALSQSELEELRTKQPEVFTAICRWVRAGGQLWVSDAGSELENLPALSKLLRLERLCRKRTRLRTKNARRKTILQRKPMKQRWPKTSHRSMNLKT